MGTPRVHPFFGFCRCSCPTLFGFLAPAALPPNNDIHHLLYRLCLPCAVRRNDQWRSRCGFILAFRPRTALPALPTYPSITNRRESIFLRVGVKSDRLGINMGISSGPDPGYIRIFYAAQIPNLRQGLTAPMIGRRFLGKLHMFCKRSRFSVHCGSEDNSGQRVANREKVQLRLLSFF